MADVQHNTLTDPELHEPKGVASANINQVYVANGDGSSGTWTDISYPVDFGNVIVGRSEVDQDPTTTDDPLQVTFGAEQTNNGVTLASDGTVTFTNGGSYLVTALLRIGRDSGTGIAAIGIRFLINGTEQQRPTCLRLTDSGYTIPFTFTIGQDFTAGDELTVQIVRDSSGADNGGLKVFNFALGDWGTAGSATIYIQEQVAEAP